MTKIEAAAAWREAARHEAALATIEAARGSDTAAHRYNVDLFERVARSIDLEIETGTPHCPCHLSPQCAFTQDGGTVVPGRPS